MFSLRARLSFYHTEVRDGAVAFGGNGAIVSEGEIFKLFWRVIIISVTWGCGGCNCCFGDVRLLLSHNRKRGIAYCELSFVGSAYRPHLMC